MKAAQLRQAILQAAVQGKLVPQNSQDEPASVLLENIQAEKATLIKEGKIKKEKPLLPIADNEKPYDLPNGWEWCRVKQLTTLITSGSRDWAKYYSKSGAVFLRMGNLSKDSFKLRLEPIQYVSPPNKGEGTRTKLKQNDLLVSITGDVGMLGLVPHGLGEAYINQHTAIVRFFSKINYQIFPFFFLSPFCQEQFKGPQRGIKNSFRLTDLEEMIVPLPPLAEQQRIVATLDELMTLCDELEAAEKELDSLEANLAEYLPKSILQAAVRGTLVPQNIHDEPASELLKCIQEEKSRLIEAGKLKKEKPLPPISEEEKPYDLPNGWEWCRLGEVCLINPRNQLPDDREVSFIPMALISNSYFGGHHQEIRVWGKVKSGFTHFAENDIVLAKITPCFQNGKSCIVKNLKNGFGAGTTELHVLRCLQISPKYLLNFLKNPEFLRDGEKNMTGTAGQQRVPTDYIKNILFPLPPLAEQQRIVAKVDELMALCEQLKNINPDSSLPLTDIQKTLPPLEISTPPEPKEQQYAIAARGDISTTETKEHRQAIEDLFGDGADG